MQFLQSLVKSCWAGDKQGPYSNVSKQSLSGPIDKQAIIDSSEWDNPSSSEVLTQDFVSNLYVFTLNELKTITKNFRLDFLLGKGGFGKVYKGFICEDTKTGLTAQPVAVKVLDLEGRQGHKEWLAEVKFLGQLSHPHLVKLIGYCSEGKQRLLVYEFMAKGSLENHLFRKMSNSLSWPRRMKILLGAAKGLAFLHCAEKPVIYRDFKTSNILLDKDYMAKLSDFGLAKVGPECGQTHVSTVAKGTYGYADPEYIASGHLSTKSDVYSFGVVLLEMLTGRPSIDHTRPSTEQNLVEWAYPLLNNKRKLLQILDPRLEKEYFVKEAQKVAKLAYQCLSQKRKSRPLMKDVVETLESLQIVNDFANISFIYTVGRGLITYEIYGQSPENDNLANDS
ncbi:hypothetical protein SUGI_0126260 [Cryptomeria japonica]|uniref:probable serine/threonine-protein kinase PBL8 n=1 Tax=Cryptomeria japonica TaxID=3369 RepID=UPI002408A4F7|nr:probable serine/threonine-protein kinase PBL8 [Cryptomeria japonica]GLJ10327.1 hypothetical protein SUGI_0126260 [Cryptomeria japonica]